MFPEIKALDVPIEEKLRLQKLALSDSGWPFGFKRDNKGKERKERKEGRKKEKEETGSEEEIELC